MSYITPNWPAPDHIKAFSSTRVGGISSGLYGAMNLGAHVGDDPKCVLTNRQRLKSDLMLPNEPVWLEQIHSTRILNADLPIVSSADGTFSRANQTVCVVMSADCLPLLLTNQAGDQVAAVHVGWRGMANGIIEQAVSLFDCEPSQIIAWAGPCIGPNYFEIDVDTRNELGGSECAYSSFKNNRLLANLHLLCQQRLSNTGVTNFSHSHACTHTDKERFFSYRRDGQCGRMASVIWIDRTQ